MNKKILKRFIAGITVWIAAIALAPVAGQAQDAAGNGAPESSGAALPPEIIELRREANASTYNIDYAAARVKYEEIRKRLPQHPAGDLYLATVIWLEYLNKTRRLQTGLYKNDSS